ncbi:MAG: TonB-dependent receptor [Acidobacteria bacterium]|nr:TonB-dependent receptor [Acidobacteriota bacterium]
MLFSQGNTGSIAGNVSDPSAAVVPGAKITITNVRTGVQTTMMADSLGNYLFNFLPPGSYKIEAEAAGFKKFVRENVSLEMNRQLRIDIQLETGAITETVDVRADTPLLETETGTLATTIENRQVLSLPTIGRNPQDFRLLVPGIVLLKDGNAVTQGGLIRKDPYYIDGAHSSNHVWSGNPVNPNPDVIQEFKVLTNSFSAEYGETSGAVMHSVTKSGTNEFHGTLFEFLQNDKLNAGNYYTHTRPVIRRNQYGGTIGGPILRNRTFFFFDMQFTKQRGTAAFNNLSVPTQAFRGGDFSSIPNMVFDPATSRTVNNAVVRDPFTGNRIPAARISTAAKNVQALYPLPQINADFANYNNFGSVKNDNYEYDIKIDHSFSAKDTFFARYSGRLFDTRPAQPFPDPRAGGRNPGQLGFGNTRNPGRQAVLNYVRVFSPRITNDLHLGWFQVFPKRDVAGYGVVSTNSLGILGMPNGDDKLGTPDFNFTNFAPLGSSGDTLFFELQNSNSLVNVTSWVLNRHTIRFGGEARQIRTDNLQPNPGTTRWTFAPIFTDQRGVSGTGFDYASFLLGLPTSFSYRIFPGYFKSRSTVYALFIQDDIRVNRKLTVNLGMRWDAPLWYHEAQNRSGVFDLDRGEYRVFGQSGFRNTPWQNDWNNFGPRIGFAYNALNKTIIRGGYGVFSVGTMSSGAFGFLLSDPIFADADVGRYNTTDQVTWKTTLDRIPYEPADKTGRNASSVSVFPDHNPMSYMQQWNLNVQREVKSVLVEVGYSGSKGTHLHYGAYNANAIPVALSPEARGRRIAPYVAYPKYPAGVGIQSWIGSSSYQALQIKSERRFSNGLGFLGAFTWQKQIDVGQVGYRDPLNNRNLDRGLGPESTPYRFSLSYTYQLPFGKGRPWLNQSGVVDSVLGGWEINGITTVQAGFPITPGYSVDSCVCGSAARPHVSANPNLPASERTHGRWFNTSVFSAPALYTIGTAGRGLVYGPGVKNWDFTIGKFFNLTERFRLQYRAEMYNMANSPYFQDPNTTFGSATFGRVTAVVNQPRQMQMALRLYF